MYFICFLVTSLMFSFALAQDVTSLSANLSLEEPKSISTSDSYSEIYSENSYRPEYESLTTDTRLRYQYPLFKNQLKAYIGVSVERDLEKNAKLQFIANAVSPQVGLLFQPFSFLTLWGEYRQRYQEHQKASGESDPRFGVSSGYFAELGQRFFFETYGEAVLVSRLSSSGVFSAYLRPFLRAQPRSYLNVDAYSELYSYSSPISDMGPSRSQARVGGRLNIVFNSWQGSLFVYKPWGIGSANGVNSKSQLEALLVFGGTF